MLYFSVLDFRHIMMFRMTLLWFSLGLIGQVKAAVDDRPDGGKVWSNCSTPQAL